MTTDASDDNCGGNKRVLSIQSHVVSGCNKAACFPLQLLGFDVDVINSVQFSNHTGYPCGWEGEVLDGSMLGKLVDGMERNGLLSDGSDSGRIGHILTGYIGSESFLRAVADVVQKLKSLNPRCRYICDPVLGDMGRYYVPEELVDIYKSTVLPLADVITPNQFEVEQLTGIPIQTIQDAQRSCCMLHDMGVSLVLITSIVFPYARSFGTAGATTDPFTPPLNDSISMFASRRQYRAKSVQQSQIMGQSLEDKTEYTEEQYFLHTPKFPGQFTGTGDITASLLLAHTAHSDDTQANLACSLEKLAGLHCKTYSGTMHAIVQRTANAAAKKKPCSSSPEMAKKVASRELQLIQSRDDILDPPRIFIARRVQHNGDKIS
ncbi:hypothetical protein ACHAXR_003992 [Thalassiosira sp. AJA248-18]